MSRPRLICYGAAAFGNSLVIGLSKFFCLVAVGGALAFGLAACGVKGPLDLPSPAAVDTAVPVDPGPPQPAQAGYAVPGAPGAVNQPMAPQRTSAAVANAPVGKQRSIFDWFVD